MSPSTTPTSAIALALLWLLASAARAADGDPPSRITILYDAFGKPSSMRQDWGFAALVEHGGKRILFDTGNDAERFAHNAATAGVDLARLDFAVVSHRHLDHSAGLTHLRRVNPEVTIYAPRELAGIFGSSLPDGFLRRNEALPSHLRYFAAAPPARIELGTPWPGARFEAVGESVEVAPGMHLLSTLSEVRGTVEMAELSLVLETPSGIVLLVGCSHPGIERIVAAARAIDPRVRLIVGGFHLPSASDEEVTRLARSFHDVLQVERIAPGHCSGEPAFAIFRALWGEGFVYAGLGEVIELGR